MVAGSNIHILVMVSFLGKADGVCWAHGHLDNLLIHLLDPPGHQGLRV